MLFLLELYNFFPNKQLWGVKSHFLIEECILLSTSFSTHMENSEKCLLKLIKSLFEWY